VHVVIVGTVPGKIRAAWPGDVPANATSAAICAVWSDSAYVRGIFLYRESEGGRRDTADLRPDGNARARVRTERRQRSVPWGLEVVTSQHGI